MLAPFLAAAIFGLSTHEPKEKLHRLVVTNVERGQRVTFYDCHSPQLENFQRETTLTVTRNGWGETVQVTLDLDGEALSYHDKRGCRFAVWLFFHRTNLWGADAAYIRTCDQFSRRYVPLAVAADPDWRTSDPDFLHDNAERFTSCDLQEVFFED